MKRKIAVFTGTRAEYGLLRSVIAELASKENIDLKIIVSGSHLAKEHGETILEIQADNLAETEIIDIGLEDNSSQGIAAATGRGVALYGKFLQEWQPDLLLILGDRYETFAVASAAVLTRIPIAHLHGGEITEGAIDDALRHAITKLSHLHFTSCDRYRQRVIQMGEDPNLVWAVGSLGVENTRKLPQPNADEMRAILGLPANGPFIVATWHPVTLGTGNGTHELKQILDALSHYPHLYYIFTGANADAGGKAINTYLQSEAANNKHLRYFPSLGVKRYIQAVRCATAVIGNSSSALIELPGLGIPILDIGDRQKGRERPAGVWHCEAEHNSILSGLRHIFSPQFSIEAAQAQNPFYKPQTAKTIADLITSFPIQKLQRKHFHDI